MTTRMSVRLATLVAIAGLSLAACGSDTPAATSSSPAADTASVADTASAAGGGSSAAGSSDGATVLGVADSSLGTIVVDGKGMTVYVFDKDTQNSGKSSCSGQCATAWPAVNTDSTTPTVQGVTGKVGTITGVDGKTQVTLDGWPLYYYASDSKAGDTTGQGVGGVWWVVTADGAKVTAAASSSGGGY